MRLFLSLLGAVVLDLGLCAPAVAHPLDPALLELRETPGGAVEVLWRVPASRPRSAPLRPVLPTRCSELGPGRIESGGARVSLRWRLDCGSGSLVGDRIGVDGLARRQTDALVRVHLADDRLVQAVVRGDSAFLTVPARPGTTRIFLDYLELGFEHILGGLDHLLLVLGLVLLVRERRALLWTITAFTLGHSVTLSLAVLGLVRAPTRLVELLIAASIFVVALELTRSRSRDLGSTSLWRSPWTFALAFGLMHGFGFAGALAEVGLPAAEIPVALLAFNSGIEIGQLLFVGVLLGARALVASAPVRWPERLLQLPAYLIGSLAALWMFERLGPLLR